MKRIILMLVLTIFSRVSYADREHNIWICRLSAESNSEYGALVDIKLQIFKERTKNSGNTAFQVLLKQFVNEHEDFKDMKYKQIRDFIDGRLKGGETDLLTSDADRMILEAGIDYAYVFAGENYKSDNLGKKRDYYFRKIYDECLSRFR